MSMSLDMNRDDRLMVLTLLYFVEFYRLGQQVENTEVERVYYNSLYLHEDKISENKKSGWFLLSLLWLDERVREVLHFTIYTVYKSIVLEIGRGTRIYNKSETVKLGEPLNIIKFYRNVWFQHMLYSFTLKDIRTKGFSYIPLFSLIEEAIKNKIVLETIDLREKFSDVIPPPLPLLVDIEVNYATKEIKVRIRRRQNQYLVGYIEDIRINIIYQWDRVSIYPPLYTPLESFERTISKYPSRYIEYIKYLTSLLYNTF